MLGSLGLG